MRRVALWAAFAAFAASGVQGQSLEQSYAQMCTEANKSSEACVALRKALIDKLSKESGGKTGKAGAVAAVAADKPLTKAQKAKLAAPWGPWADLVGKSYASGDMLRTYSWKIPYEIIAVSSESPEGKGGVELTLSGEDILTDGKDPTRRISKNEYVLLQDGYRARYVFVPGGRDRIVERLKEGQWLPEGEPEKLRVVPDAELAMVKSRILTARMQRDLEIAQQWGVANALAGKRFLGKRSSGTDEDILHLFRWQERGARFEHAGFHVPSGKKAWTNVYQRKPDGSIVLVEDANAVVRVTASEFLVQAGEKVTQFGPRNGDLAFRQQQATSSPMNEWTYTDVTSLSSDQIVKQAANQLAQRKNAQAAAQAAQARAEAEARAQAEAQSEEGMGLLGALGGAMVGIFAGGDTEQVIGAAMKGAAIVDPNSELAQGLNTAGDALITGDTSAIDAAMGSSPLGGLASAVGGGGGNALGGGGGGWKDPVSMPGCDAVGVTRENFKTSALSGGNDVQLKTLCGAAYNYYWMYRNAENQGYSPDGADITFQEHAKAAAVVNEFYAGARAD